MKKTAILTLGSALLLAMVSRSMADQGGRLRSGQRAQLPAALKTRHPPAAPVPSDEQAARVRGQWWLTVDLPLVATMIQGQGHFDLNILTLSGGVFAGNPVMVNITVGDRDVRIQSPRPAASSS